MSKLHILFFSHYFPPESNAPASRTYENARRWVQAGHQVTVITCAPNVPDGAVYAGYRNRLRQVEHIDGIRVVRVWTYIAPNAGTVRRIVNYISYMFSAVVFACLEKRPTIVIATSPQFFCGWAGVLFCRLRRLPLLLEIRDIWPESIVAVGAMRESPMIRVLEWLELKMYAAARQIVTVGDGYRQRLLASNVPASRIAVIMNGVDRELFQAQAGDEQLKQQWQLNGKFVCSYSGTIGMACGLEIVLDAAQQLQQQGCSDVVFLLIGDGAARQSLQTQAQAKGLDNIVFTGRQPRQLMPALLAISDVCLVHLKKTALFTTVMPSKIFEAAGMAKPIINGVAGFAAEFITSAGAGINIEPEDSQQLVAALLTLQADAAARQAYAAAGQKYVLRHFDRDRLADEYLQLLVNVAATASHA